MCNSSWEGLLGLGQIYAISWAKHPLSSGNVENNPGGQCQVGMHKYGEEGESSFPRLHNATLVKAEPWPRLTRLADSPVKASKSMNAWQHQVIVEVINSACKT